MEDPALIVSLILIPLRSCGVEGKFIDSWESLPVSLNRVALWQPVRVRQANVCRQGPWHSSLHLADIKRLSLLLLQSTALSTLSMFYAHVYLPHNAVCVSRSRFMIYSILRCI